MTKPANIKLKPRAVWARKLQADARLIQRGYSGELATSVVGYEVRPRNLGVSIWTDGEGYWVLWLVSYMTKTGVPLEKDISMVKNAFGLPNDHPIGILNDGIEMNWTESDD